MAKDKLYQSPLESQMHGRRAVAGAIRRKSEGQIQHWFSSSPGTLSINAINIPMSTKACTLIHSPNKWQVRFGILSGDEEYWQIANSKNRS